MSETVQTLAVVPARGGSKTIAKKNLCAVAGKSLIAHTASTAHDVPHITHAVISSDDEAMLAEAKAHGLDAPFVRPPELASDTATSVAMWQHAWQACEAHYGVTFSRSVLLEPTSPLRTAEDVIACLDLLEKTRADSVVTISPTPAHYTPHKTLLLDEENQLSFYHEAGKDHSIRQTIPPMYHRNGACYAITRDALFENNSIITDNSRAHVIDRPLVNIDEPFDLEMADWLMTR